MTASRDVAVRAEVIRARLAYEADPAGFAARHAAADTELARRIAAARNRVDQVVLPDGELNRIAALCAAFDVDGMRADPRGGPHGGGNTPPGARQPRWQQKMFGWPPNWRAAASAAPGTFDDPGSTPPG